MYLKLHNTPAGQVVAVCDAAIMGKVLCEGNRRLDLEAHSGFYRGKKVGLPEAAEALSGAQNANLVGEKSIKAASLAGLDVSGAITISGVPHLQVYRF